MTVDGNAHVERHVRRRRDAKEGLARGRGTEGRGGRRGQQGRRGGTEEEGRGCVWSGSSPGDAVLIARASGLK